MVQRLPQLQPERTLPARRSRGVRHRRQLVPLEGIQVFFEEHPDDGQAEARAEPAAEARVQEALPEEEEVDRHCFSDR